MGMLGFHVESNMVWPKYTSFHPEGPDTQELRFLVSNTVDSIDLGARTSRIQYVDPLGLSWTLSVGQV